MFPFSVVFIYDYIITLGAEGTLFWRKKFSGATVLFLFNRYLVLFYTIYTIPLSMVSLSEQVRHVR